MDRCKNCRFWSKGYRLQTMKTPPFCDRHNHSQPGDDPACMEFQAKEETP
jgi:hypothetical protein